MKTTTSNTISPAQIKQIHTLLNQLGKMAYKIDYVIEITNGRESSTKHLTFREAATLISWLQGEVKSQPEPADKMRKKVISCLREAGYNIGDRADMKRIYDWVEKYGYLHKPLNEYTLNELPALVTQAKKLKESFLNGLVR